MLMPHRTYIAQVINMDVDDGHKQGKQPVADTYRLLKVDHTAGHIPTQNAHSPGSHGRYHFTDGWKNRKCYQRMYIKQYPSIITKQ